MKSFILTIVVFFSIIGFTNAQSFHLGVKGGANVNKLSGQSFKDQFTFGYHAGLFAEIPLSKKWSLQPEVVFNEVRSDTSSKFSQLYNLNVNRASQIKLNYLSVPLLLNYKVAKFLSLQAGPQYGILIQQQNNLLENGKSAFKNGDFSMLAGVQANIANVRIYAKYAVGLNNINDIDNNDKWKNQSIQLGVGLTLF